MNIEYSNAKSIITQLYKDLPADVSQTKSISPTSRSAITDQLNKLQRSISTLEDIAKRAISAVEREKAKSRANEIRNDFGVLNKRWDDFKRAEKERKEREELLQRTSAYGTAGSTLESRHRHGSASTEDTSISILDYFHSEQAKLGKSGDAVDSYIVMARQSLQELVDQRGMLKATQRRLLDIANTLGLSGSVVRLIEQRTTQDKYIFWGGVSLTILVVIFMLYWLG